MDLLDDWRSYATICRLCLQRDGFMLGIFNHIQGREKSISKKIMDCTELQVSSGDGLPSCICHRCLYKIELCLEFKQQCCVSDATLRQINGIPSIHENGSILTNFGTQNYSNQEDDVVMVVDPLALDYDSEYESEEQQTDPESQDLHEFRNVFMCKYCDQAFTVKSDCLAHEDAAHNRTVPYSCSQCDMGFGDRAQYSAHLKSVHQNDKPYNCPQCERTFARRSDLRKHTVVHTGIKPFTCSVCFKSFSRNTNLSKHMRIHSGQKPFVCPKCPKTFISKGDLTRHAIIHSGQKPFSCNYCHLTFGRRDKLLRHEKRHFPQENTEDKSLELEILRQNLSLNDYGVTISKDEGENIGEQIVDINKQDGWTSSENMVINLDPFNHNSYGNPERTPQSDFHSEEPEMIHLDHDLPHVPEHIEEAVQNSVLNDSDLPHVPEHITGDSFGNANSEIDKKSVNKVKRYPCLTCHKRFASFEGLRFHMAVHSGERPHSCTICNKSFLRKRELDRHVATHTGMKPFRCTNCDKRFGRKDKLVRHMRIHDVNREHVCMICGVAFNRKDALSLHMKTHKENTELC